MKTKTLISLLMLLHVLMLRSQYNVSPLIMGQGYHYSSYNQYANKDAPVIFNTSVTPNPVWPDVTASNVLPFTKK